MRTLVATTDIAGATAPTVRPEHMERIEAAAAEVLSANTRRAYASAWRAWVAWCAADGGRREDGQEACRARALSRP